MTDGENPERDPDADPDPEHRQDMGTAAALAGVGLAGAAILGIMSMVIPDISKILLVLLGLIGIGVIQYLIWGWKLDRNRVRDDDDEFWNPPYRRR